MEFRAVVMTDKFNQNIPWGSVLSPYFIVKCLLLIIIVFLVLFELIVLIDTTNLFFP